MNTWCQTLSLLWPLKFVSSLSCNGFQSLPAHCAVLVGWLRARKKCELRKTARNPSVVFPPGSNNDACSFADAYSSFLPSNFTHPAQSLRINAHSVRRVEPGIPVTLFLLLTRGRGGVGGKTSVCLVRFSRRAVFMGGVLPVKQPPQGGAATAPRN